MLESPPMQLQQVDPLDAQPVEAAADAGAHHLRRHRPRLGAPLGQHGRARPAVPADGPGGGRRCPPHCRNGRPCRRCRTRPRHSRAAPRPRASRSSGPLVALHVGDLPQAGDHPADRRGRAASSWRSGRVTAGLPPLRRRWPRAVPAGRAAAGRRRRTRPEGGRALVQQLGEQRPAIAALAAAHPDARCPLERGERGGARGDGRVDLRQVDLLAAADDVSRVIARTLGLGREPRTAATGPPGTGAGVRANAAGARVGRPARGDGSRRCTPSASAAVAPPRPQQSPTARTSGTVVRQSRRAR